MAGDGGQDQCPRCGLVYNREERCPRTLVCGHTSCNSCLDTLIQEDERRCPTCRRPFFSLSCVLIPKNREVLERLGESTKSSSYSSPLKLKSSLSVGSSTTRSSFSRSMLSSSSALGSSTSQDSFQVGGPMRPRSEGGVGGVSAASTGVLLPPPVPATPPPSLDETFSDPQVSSTLTRSSSRSQMESKVEDKESGGGISSGFSRFSTPKGSSVDQPDGGTHTTPTYSFPTIRTQLSTTGMRAESDAPTSSSVSGKPELRPTKSLPPVTSSSAAFRSLSPLSSTLNTRPEGSSSSASPAGYKSPFLKSSLSSSSSSLNTTTLRSLQSGSKKRDNTFSESLSGGWNGSGVPSSSSTDSVDSSGFSRSVPGLHKLEAKLSVPPAGKKQDEVDLGVSKWKLGTPTSLLRKKYGDVTSTKEQDVASVKTHGTDAASSHTARQGDASKQTDKQSPAVPPSTRSSGTPNHVLQMCRNITSKTRPAAEDTAEVTNKTSNSSTSVSSYQRTTSSSSSSSFFSSSSSSSSSLFSSSSHSSAATPKDAQSYKESSQAGQDATKDPKESQMIGMREAAPETPPPDLPPSGGASDGHSRSFSLRSSFGSRDDADDTSESCLSRAGALKGMKVQCDEAGDASRHSPPASSPVEKQEKSKETRKLALSASLSARLGARTRFLATAIDEETEDDSGDGAASAGEGQVRTGRDDKLHKPDRQAVQPSRPRGSLGARISARASYLSGEQSGGGSEVSRTGVQAEDSTKIDPQRRAGLAWTKRGAAAGERHRASTGGEDRVAEASSYREHQHLSTAEGGDVDDAVKASPSHPTPPEPPTHRETGSTGVTEASSLHENKDNGAEAGTDGGTDRTGLRSPDAAIPGSTKTKGPVVERMSRGTYSGYQRSRDAVGSDAAPTHELSQHSRWRHHRLIDSRAKEELSGPSSEPQAAFTKGVANTCRDEKEARTVGASLPDEQPSAPNPSGLRNSVSGSGGSEDWQTKHSEKREETPPVFRPGTGNANTVSGGVDGSSDTTGRILGRRSSLPDPQPPSNLYPWKKKWRSVTERTSFAATQHTRTETQNIPLSGDSKQPNQSTPAPPGVASEVEGSRAAGSKEDRSLSTQHSEGATSAAGSGRSAYPSLRDTLGALSIGRVSSIQDTDGEVTETHTSSQDADTVDDTPSGSIFTRDRREGIQTEGDTHDAAVGTDVKDTSVLRRSERTEAWVASSGTNEGKHSTRTPDSVHQTRSVPGGATEYTGRREEPASGADGEDTQEDINARLRSARLRLRGTSTTPTEEDVPPAPARTNLSYLLTRLQGTSAKKTSHPIDDEDDDEVFDESSETEEDEDTKHHPPSISSFGSKTNMNKTEDKGHDYEEATDEPDSVTRRPQARGDQDTPPFVDTAGTASQEEQDEAQSTDEDCTDAPYEGPHGGVTEEYEPGVGLCSSHGRMLHLYCEDCEEWVCDDCLRVLHRPRPEGSCRVISASEGVKQMKVSHESFLASRTNTLEYFRAELQRIVDECDSSIALHKNNLLLLEEKMDEEERLLRGIESMRSLAKDKLNQVDYWEDVLQKNLSRIDESSTSSDVLNAVRESSSDILQKAMEAVSLEAGAGLLLSPPN